MTNKHVLLLLSLCDLLAELDDLIDRFHEDGAHPTLTLQPNGKIELGVVEWHATDR